MQGEVLGEGKRNFVCGGKFVHGTKQRGVGQKRGLLVHLVRHASRKRCQGNQGQDQEWDIVGRDPWEVEQVFAVYIDLGARNKLRGMGQKRGVLVHWVHHASRKRCQGNQGQDQEQDVVGRDPWEGDQGVAVDHDLGAVGTCALQLVCGAVGVCLLHAQ